MEKKILVIGGAGYIGSAVTKLLVEADMQVVVFDDLSNGQQDKVTSPAVFIEGDINNENDLESVFSQNEFAAVIHLAAKKVMSESESNPTLYFQNNVGGTLNILSAMEKHGVPHIVFSSTAAVYAPTNASTPVTEQAPVEPVSVYGRSKLMAEQLIQEFVRCGKIQSYSILRYFNVAGDTGLNFEEKNPQGVFPLLAKAMEGDVVFSVTGTDYDTKDGSGVRDYIHLYDLATAHLAALSYPHSEVFNLGTSNGFTVLELIKTFEAATGKSVSYEAAPRRPGDLAVMLADSSRARELLKWEPVKSLEDMVESLVRVYNLR